VESAAGRAGGEKIEFTVPEEDAGTRLDVFVGRLPEVGSRSRAAALIAAGAVSVGGTPVPKSRLLTPGESVTLSVPEQSSFDIGSRMAVPVLFEDEWLLVVDKPAGMVVHPSRGHTSDTLVHALSDHGLAGGEQGRPGIVHRLDKDTSGLLLVAKSAEAHRRLVGLMRRRAVERRYLALVHGSLGTDTGTIEAPVGRDPVRRTSMTVGGLAAREATTHFEVLERFADLTLVEARLETGRTHQIRVHFSAIGHPVLGDPLYARRDRFGLMRQFLHSHRLAFVHPFTGLDLAFEAPLPEELDTVLARLREDGERHDG
jgi:23S rRNA pseudouridine1911/1915/1917 synthase